MAMQGTKTKIKKLSKIQSSFPTKATLALLLSFGLSQAQVATDSWAVGVGLSYPRFFSVNIDPQNKNYGAYISGQRNVSEHVSIRTKGSFSRLEGEWENVREKTTLATVDFGLLYTVVPCERLSPYLFAGFGGNYKSLSDRQSASIDKNSFGGQLHLGLGSEYRLDPAWSLVTEFGYYITDNSDLDGTYVPAEMDGKDSYMAFSIGVNFRFGKGKPSTLCNSCAVAAPVKTDSVDYQRIESLIIKHIPGEVTKEVLRETVKEIPVDRYIQEVAKDKLILVGVNFAFDKSDLLPESYPVLDKSVEMLKVQPEVKIEIQGYTDYVGSLSYNRDLSLERAEKVKTYFVAQGIAENRISTFGYGKRNPVEDNETAEGREMNRRITIRIIK